MLDGSWSTPPTLVGIFGFSLVKFSLNIFIDAASEEAAEMKRKKWWMLGRDETGCWRRFWVTTHRDSLGLAPIQSRWTCRPNHQHLDCVYLFTCNLIHPCNKPGGSALPVLTGEPQLGLLNDQHAAHCCIIPLLQIMMHYKKRPRHLLLDLMDLFRLYVWPNLKQTHFITLNKPCFPDL